MGQTGPKGAVVVMHACMSTHTHAMGWGGHGDWRWWNINSLPSRFPLPMPVPLLWSQFSLLYPAPLRSQYLALGMGWAVTAVVMGARILWAFPTQIQRSVIWCASRNGQKCPAPISTSTVDHNSLAIALACCSLRALPHTPTHFAKVVILPKI